jgi:hypothetical protein
VYKEVASADETDNVFSATAAGTAFEFDATKLAFTGGSLGLKVVSIIKYDIANGSYDSVSFSVTGQDTAPQSMVFSTDGTKMFMLGSTGNSVYQYTLTTGFDLSTASYDSVSLSVSGQGTFPGGLVFNTTGTKMYMTDINNRSVFQYTLTTGFDISTASYDSVSFSLASQDTQPRDIGLALTVLRCLWLVLVVTQYTNTPYQLALICLQRLTIVFLLVYLVKTTPQKV